MTEPLTISQFKKRKNRQRPDLVYSFEHRSAQYIFTIFTMNAGVSFSVEIETNTKPCKRFNVFSEENVGTKEEALEKFNVFLSEKSK